MDKEDFYSYYETNYYPETSESDETNYYFETSESDETMIEEKPYNISKNELWMEKAESFDLDKLFLETDESDNNEYSEYELFDIPENVNSNNERVPITPGLANRLEAIARETENPSKWEDMKTPVLTDEEKTRIDRVFGGKRVCSGSDIIELYEDQQDENVELLALYDEQSSDSLSDNEQRSNEVSHNNSTTVEDDSVLSDYQDTKSNFTYSVSSTISDMSEKTYLRDQNQRELRKIEHYVNVIKDKFQNRSESENHCSSKDKSQNISESENHS